MKKIFFLTGCFITGLSLQAQLKLSNALQSQMVVQQNKPFKVWGSAGIGRTVKVQADWSKTTTEVTVDPSGSFVAIIDVPPAKPYDYSLHRITVSAGNETIRLDSLLIGDLWFCSGQSNMQFSLGEDTNSAKEVPLADLPSIRLLRVDLNFSATPVEDFKGKWELCTPETAKKFSAVGYAFGKELFQQLHIPIGLVFSGIGASAAQAYVPQDVLKADTMLDRVYLQPYLNSEKSKEKIDGGFSFEKVTRPFLLYNAIIHPFRNLSIKGFTWYQGESNRNERASYTRLTQAMIEAWRKNFAQGQLPFYYVQVAPFFYDKEDPRLADYAFFREAQENISTLNNTGMVVTMDVGEAKDLHPKNKLPIGWRLAQLALNRTYGKLDLPYEGPTYDHLELNGSKAIIHFTPSSVASGLQTKDGRKPAFFTIAGADKVFHPAEATISGNTVIVSSAKVNKPVAVRYAFTNYPVTNFENKARFPAVPFRTDNFSE
ncbi:MAG: sialate O-acetylesterase [Citrobacter freundii]|nr:MAG: sialate O-acetylesterase [Citrobacter freundii]